MLAVPPTRSVSRLVRLAFAIVASTVIHALASAPVHADAGLGVQVVFSTPVSVGQSNVAGLIDIQNTSTPNTLTITLDSISLLPSCGGYTVITCTTPDPNVFSINSPATGRAGTSCAGVPFTTTLVPADGSYTFTPAVPIGLGTPGSGTDTCIIDFTFNVLKTPNVDASGAAGIQTRPSALALGTASNSTQGFGWGNTFVTVNRDDPGIATVATAGPVIVGTAISDTATLSGGTNPTGSITFNLYAPSDPTCAAPPVFSSTVPVNGNGNYLSGNFISNAVGIYHWIASYSGDANNAPVSGACGDTGESSVVTTASPSFFTQASGTTTAGSNIFDTATLTGVNPTGTITFNLYGPNDATCAGASIFNSVVPVNGNGNYPSGNFQPMLVGTYRWIASYSGDANNAGVSGSCNDPNENVVITQATPAIVTQAVPTSGTIGVSVADGSTLSLGAAPTGTIIFRLYGPNDATCTNLVFTSDAIAVNGNGSYGPSTPSFVPTVPGTYRWIASYSGDANNAPVAGACGAANETVTVNRATPTLSTTASAGGIVGVSVNDTANLSGGFAPLGGTITFRLYGPSATNVCNAGNLVFTSTAVTVNGAGAYPSPSFTPTVAGTYRWIATYSGDTNNNSRVGTCGEVGETVVITQATPGLTTTASAGGAVGVSVTDTANLTGGSSPTGSITFRLYGPSATTVCTSGNLVFTSTPVPVSGAGSYPSPAFVPTTAGTYRWIASYSGDANNAAVAGACGDANETVVITQVTPSMSTTASAGGVVGVSVTDTANLSGGASPTGTITFRLYGPSATAVCTAGNLVFTSNAIPVNGNGSYPSAPGFAPTTAGTYRWIASYSGDANNVAVAGNCGDANETVVITQATPSMSTTASAGGAIGVSVTDTATISGGASPTGTVTFRLYGPSATAVCTAGNLVFTSNAIPVNGNGNYLSAPGFAPTAVGTYRWIASYSGDVNNVAVAGNCGDANETVVITQATPSMTTVASAGGAIGVSVTDTATLSGGFTPTGNITFRLYGPSATAVCNAGNLVFTSNAVTVNGNGAYPSAPGFSPTAAGTYRWIASYSGDANNVAVAGNCGDANESVVIGQTTPSMITQASAGGAIGVSVTDTATLSGGTSPTGTITFRLYGPSATAVCNAGNLVFTSNAVTVNGNGAYPSAPGFAPTLAGTYRWIASYSGDANNGPVEGACGDANESVVITQTTPTLVTQASAAIQLGGSVTDTATLSGGTNPTGTITFRLYGPDDATCANAAVFTSNAVTVTGNGQYVSTPSFTPTAVGTYRWIASYSGDTNNVPLAGNCNDANESVVVSQATPSIVTQASPGGQRGISVTDAATLSGGTNPTGSITFRLYGPNDATCANAPVFTSNAIAVDGNGTYTSAPGFTPTLPGTYRWIATYSGDAGNAGIAGACNDPNEQVTITDLPPPPDVPIPTMSEGALILMSMFVGLVALVTLRRGRGYR